MAPIPHKELNPEKRRHFLSLHKLVCTEVERNDRVITVRVFSHPLSSVAIAECSSYLGVFVPFVCFSEGDRACGCVRALRVLCVPWSEHSCAFQLVNPTGWQVWAARS